MLQRHVAVECPIRPIFPLVIRQVQHLENPPAGHGGMGYHDHGKGRT